LATDLYDHPEHVKRLTWQTHDLWFRYFDRINRLLQPVNPGYTCWCPIFSSRPYYMLQCDFSAMISPAMFDEFVKPELAATCRRLPNAFYHLDGPGQLPHLDSLLEIPELKGIQWVPGAGQPDWRYWPDVFRRIRAAGKLIQVYGWPLETLDVLAEQIGSPKGICLIGEAGLEQEDQLLRLIERYDAQ
jgi:5-methyltetrahydrofolate--homocysteine methyltransferase